MRMALTSWNVNGLRRHKEDILNFLDDNFKIDYIVLNFQETHSFIPININGYQMEFISSPQGPKARQGLATYVKNGYYYETVDIESPKFDIIAIKLFVPYELVVANIYIPPNKNVERADLKNIMDQLSDCFCLIGDFNAHSSIWSSTNSNRTGRILEDIIINSDNLVIMNNGTPTHLSTHNTFTSPDICICTSNLCEKFYWTVSEDFYSCDHAPMSLIPSNTQNNTNLFTPITKYRFDEANWMKFNDKLDLLTDFVIPGDPKLNMESFAKGFIEAAKDEIPVKKHPKKPMRYWWNIEINEAIRERKRICKKARKKKTTEIIVEFKKARAKVKFLIKRSIKKKNSEAVEQINFKKSSKSAWNLTNRLCGRQSFHSVNTVLQS